MPGTLVTSLRYHNRTSPEPVPGMGDITQLLHKWREGDRDAENELFALVLPDLRRLAHYLMKGERKDHTLQPTELVDQIYFRLVGAKNRDWHNRQHFFAIAGRAMRRYLIDHARGRPNAEFVAIEGMENLIPGDSEKVNLALMVDGLLDQLAATKPEWCTLVEVKYFLGLTDEEAADALGMKLRTMQRMWLEARKWLFDRMESGSASQSA
jgi:RNA polymerase sigma factor (TIGR02999 family)